MKNRSMAILAITGLLAFVIGYSYTHTHSHPTNTRTVSQHVKLLKPVCEQDHCKGGYAYNDDGIWYYYWFNMSQPTAITSNPYSSYSSLPSSGTWSKSSVAPAQETVEQDSQVSMAENEHGQPASFEETLDAAMQDNPENAGYQADNQGDNAPSVSNEAAASETASAPSTNDTSSSSSSDSGSSGGDSGGGGGDGGSGGD
jgi:uncharacterized membrane protein YgcG